MRICQYEIAGELSAEKRLNQAYDALNKLIAPDYFVWLRIRGTPRTPIRGAALRGAVSTFLAGLSFESVLHTYQNGGLEALPFTVFKHQGCEIAVSPIPKSSQTRGSPSVRPIGAMGPEARWLNVRTPLKQAIRSKASAYGRFRRPYIIVANVVDERAHKTDVMSALFGREAFRIRRDAPEDIEMFRHRDGAWFGPTGPINRRVSGVIVLSQLQPWTVAAHEPVLYYNPFARRRCPPKFFWLPSHQPRGDNLEFVPGVSARELFKLPDGWPLHVEK